MRAGCVSSFLALADCVRVGEFLYSYVSGCVRVKM